MIRFIAQARVALIVGAWSLGAPLLLLDLTGSPLPSRWPTITEAQVWLDDPIDPTYRVATMRVLAWVIWALLTSAMLTLLAPHLRHTRWRRILHHLPPPAQGMAAALLGTAAVATAASSTQAAPAIASTNHHGLTTKSLDAPAPAPASPRLNAAAGTADRHHDNQRQQTAPHAARAEPVRIHAVKAGDTLWDIAREDLGRPQRWRAIYTLNRGHRQTDGYALTDPNQIHVGWTLALPTRLPTPTRTTPGHAGRSTPAPGGGSVAAHPHATSPVHTPQTLTDSPTPAPSRKAASSEASTPTSPSANRANASPGPSPTDATDTSSGTEGSGITMPAGGWISLGLATSIAAIGALLRLNRRRHQGPRTPIAVATGPAPNLLPEPLRRAETAGRRNLGADLEPSTNSTQPKPSNRPGNAPVPLPLGVTPGGAETSLLDLPAAALTGSGTDAVARAMLASVLATGVLEQPVLRPVVVTTASVLARLLPEGVERGGLDPDRVTFDGERLIVLAETGDAVTHAEEEMITRRRLLDNQDAESIADLNRMAGHAEIQPAYVVLVDATDRHVGRLAAVAANAARLDLHVLVLGRQGEIPRLSVDADGVITEALASLPAGTRLSTLAAPDLPPLLTMIAEAAPRPEEGTDLDHPAQNTSSGEQNSVAAALVPDLPASAGDAVPPVRLVVLGPVTVGTERGPVTTGMRSGSYAVLAVLAAYPHGRTLDQLAADLHPDTDPGAAIKRLRTDITTARRVLRTATDLPKAMFIVNDPVTGRYRLDPDLVAVDLWQMLAAIGRANTAPDDAAALAALREAADLYGGDFAANQDRAWVVDYQTTHRDQILNVYSRIAEILEADQPDAALAALDQALACDPVNEELYQRVMRIQGRQQRPDAVRRTLRRLENQLAELGGAEPSEATRRLAARQLHHPLSEARR